MEVVKPQLMICRGRLSGTVPTRVRIRVVIPTEDEESLSARQQEISNHFSDTKATGISCLSLGEGLLWGKHKWLEDLTDCNEGNINQKHFTLVILQRGTFKV